MYQKIRKGGKLLISIEMAVEKVKNGEIELFEIIIEQFQQQLFHYCYHMLGNTQEAEDAVQESLIKAYEKIQHYTYSMSFSAWLYKIAYHHCLNLIRRRKLIRFIPFLSDREMIASTIEDRIENNQLSKPLLEAFCKLSPTEKSIVLLRVFKEKSFDEISKILDIKASTVRKKYERARKKLKMLLTDSQRGGTINEEFSFRG